MGRRKDYMLSTKKALKLEHARLAAVALDAEILSEHEQIMVEALAAERMAVQREPSHLVKRLTASLHCYVSEDDVALDRRAFLAMVASRITQDLATGDY